VRILQDYNLRRLYRCFLLCGPKSVGPILPEGLTAYDATPGRLWITLARLAIFRSVITIFELLRKQLIGKRFTIKRRREASCHLLPAYTCYPFILRGDKTLLPEGGQILECTWGLRGGLMCTICWPCTVGTLSSQYTVKLHLS
jgi:hypothetical protein